MHQQTRELLVAKAAMHPRLHTAASNWIHQHRMLLENVPCLQQRSPVPVKPHELDVYSDGSLGGSQRLQGGTRRKLEVWGPCCALGVCHGVQDIALQWEAPNKLRGASAMALEGSADELPTQQAARLGSCTPRCL